MKNNSSVDYITYQGKKHPLRMGMLAISDYEEQTKSTVQSIGDDMKLYALFLWFSIRKGYEFLDKPFYKTVKKNDKEEEVPIVTIRDCYWILDESFMVFLDIFKKSMIKLEGVSEEEFDGRMKKILESDKKK